MEVRNGSPNKAVLALVHRLLVWVSRSASGRRVRSVSRRSPAAGCWSGSPGQPPGSAFTLFTDGSPGSGAGDLPGRLSLPLRMVPAHQDAPLVGHSHTVSTPNVMIPTVA